MTRARISMAAAVTLMLVHPATARAQREALLDGVRTLGSAMAADPSSRAAAIRAAADRMQTAMTEWDRSIAALERQAHAAFSDTTALTAWRVRLAVAYRERGRIDDALAELDAVAAAGVTSSDAELLRGLMFDAAGRAAEAARTFAHAWTLAPGDPLKAYYAALYAAAPADAQARTALVDAYGEVSRRTPAGTARLIPKDAPHSPFPVLDPVPDPLAAAPIVADADTIDAFALMRSGRFSDAIAALRHAGTTASSSAESPAAHMARGHADELQGRITDARREYEAALPGTLAGRAALLVGLGRLAQVDGDPDAAVEAFTAAAKLDPNSPNVHKELALALAPQGHVDAALREAMAALLIDPLDTRTHAMIGQFLLDAGRNADAVAPLTRALTLQPRRYETHYALATAFARLGRADDAARERQLFERGRVDAVQQRRQQIRHDVEREEAIRARSAQERK